MTRALLFVFCLVSLSAFVASATGCATVRVKEPEPGSCVVTAKYLVGGREAHVKDHKAKIPGLLGDRDIAYMKDDGTLVYSAGIMELESGEAKDGKLILKGLGLSYSSDPIADGKVRVPMPLGSRDFTYEGDCRVEDAALGAFALFKMEDEDNMTATAAAN